MCNDIISGPFAIFILTLLAISAVIIFSSFIFLLVSEAWEYWRLPKASCPIERMFRGILYR